MQEKNLVVIPARSGSKGIKDKNIQILGNKTLLNWAIDFAKSLDISKDIYISTDSLSYEAIAKKGGVKSLGLRKEELSGDNVSTKEVIADMLRQLPDEYENIILLQPTSPFRRIEDVKAILAKIKEGYAAGTTVSHWNDPHPLKMKMIGEDGLLKPYIFEGESEVARQSLPNCYVLTGGVYIVSVKAFKQESKILANRTFPYVVSYNYANIDTHLDLNFARYLYEKEQGSYEY